METLTFDTYKAGQGQKELPSGPVAAGGEVEWSFDTAQTGIGRGTGSFVITQPNDERAFINATLNGVPKNGQQEVSWALPDDVKLEPNTRYVVRAKVSGPTSRLVGKLGIQGKKR